MNTEGTFTFLGERSFQEMGVPDILYKYRNWKNPYEKTVLTKKEVYFSPPTNFEDPFDCRVPIRYDLLTEERIYQIYMDESKAKNPHYNRSQHRAFVHEWMKKGLLTNPRRVKKMEEEFFNEFTKLFGILCLTAHPDNITMWEKYSDHHAGICVGFHTIPLFTLDGVAGGGGEVNYFDDLPIIMPFDDLDENHYLQIYSKLRKWEFEKEYRVTKINIKKRNVEIPENIFAEIILGANLQGNSRLEVLDAIRENFNSIVVKQAFVEGDIVRFEIVKI